MHPPPRPLWAVMVVWAQPTASLLSPHPSPHPSPSPAPPPPPPRHGRELFYYSCAVLTPVCETRSETFKSKVTAASEAFNLHLKERAPPLTPTPPRPHPFLHPCPRPLHSHILDHPVPPRHLRSVCCVFASVHSLSWMNVCFDLGAHDTPAGQSASSIKGTICRLFM